MPWVSHSPLFLGMRYLLKKKLSYLAIVGVAVSVGTLIVVMSVMSGFEKQLRAVIRGYLSDLTVLPYAGELYGLSDWKQKREEILKVEHVQAAAPYVEGPGLIRIQNHVEHIFFRGMEPELEPEVTLFGAEQQKKGFMQHGALSDLRRVYLDENDVELPACLIGSEMAKRWSYYYQLWDLLSENLSEPDRSAVLNLLAEARRAPKLEESRARMQKAVARLGRPSPERSAVLDLLAQAMHAEKLDESRALMEEAVARLRTPSPNRSAVLDLLAEASRAKKLDESRGLMQRAVVRLDPARVLAQNTERALRDEIALVTVVTEPRLAWRLKGYVVAGVFNTGRYDYDNSVVLLSLDSAIDFVASEGRVTGLNLKLDDYANAPLVRAALEPAYIVRTWEDQQRTFLEAVAMERFLMALILCFVGVLAGFCIFAILTMTVYEKRRDIGVLKAVGFTSGDVAMTFLVDGGAIGVLGALVGTVGGLLFAYNINEIAAFVEKLTGWTPFPKTIYYFTSIPVDRGLTMPLAIATGAVLLSLIFSVMPAVKASRMDPVQTLRFE